MGAYKTNRVTVAAVVFVLSTLPLSSALSADPNMSLSVDIAPQPLEAALVELSKQGHLQLVIATGTLPTKTCAPLRGSMSLGAALDRLLRDTGLTYKFVGDHTIAIVKSVGLTNQLSEPPASPGVSGATGPGFQNNDGNVDRGSRNDNANKGDQTVNHRNLLLRLATFLGICVSASVSGPACAQEAAGDQPVNSQVLEEVTVTARRVEENLQDVPLTVSVLTSDMLTSNPIKNQWDLQSYVPGLTVSMSSGSSGSGSLSGANYALRGLRSAGVVTYFADVPTAATTSRALYDMASIQVLEGPQGTLFGKNTTAGAILFGPGAPTDKVEGYGQLSGGTYNLEAVQGMINLPVVENKLMVRVAGEVSTRDGWQKVEPLTTSSGSPSEFGSLAAQGSDRHNSFRVTVLFKPTDRLENLTIYQKFIADEAPQEGQEIVNLPCPATPSVAQRFVYAPCIYQPPLTTTNSLPSWNQEVSAGLALGARATADPSQQRNYNNDWQLINRTSLEVTDNLTAKNIFGLVRTFSDYAFDADATIFPVLQVDMVNSSKTLSDEAQVHGTYGKLQFTAGNFYSDLLDSLSNTDANVGVLGPNPSNPAVSHTHLTNRGEAIYGQVSYEILPSLDLTAGGRYTWIKKSSIAQSYLGPVIAGTDHGPCQFNAKSLYVNLPTCTQTLGPATFNTPTWNASISYKFTDKILTYFTVSNGFDEGGFNNASSDFPTYAPEKLLDFETGLKADWQLFGRPIRSNADVYLSKFTDIQRSVTRVNDQGIGVGGTINAASATVWGTQVKLDMRVTDYLSLTANANTIHAKYNTFDYAPAVGGGFISTASNALALAPKFTASVGATYHLPISPSVGKDLSATVNYSYQSTEYTTDINPSNPLISNTLDPYSTISGYGLVNLQVNWRGMFGRAPIDGSFFMTNVTDKLYRTGIVNTINSYGTVQAFYGLPRMLGASLRYSFD